MKNIVVKSIAGVHTNTLNKEKGITLIALIITIIVLIILAGVTVATLAGENGLLNKAKLAKETTDNVTNEENEKIDGYENEIDNYNVLNRKNGEITEYELFNSETGTYGSDITISDSYKNYNEIEIYYFTCAHIDYGKSYQSAKIKVSDLVNQNNIIVLGGLGKDVANIYYHATGYRFENDTTLKWSSSIRRSMNNGAMWYGDQIHVKKIVGYK